MYDRISLHGPSFYLGATIRIKTLSRVNTALTVETATYKAIEEMTDEFRQSGKLDIRNSSAEILPSLICRISQSVQNGVQKYRTKLVPKRLFKGARYHWGNDKRFLEIPVLILVK